MKLHQFGSSKSCPDVLWMNVQDCNNIQLKKKKRAEKFVRVEKESSHNQSNQTATV